MDSTEAADEFIRLADAVEAEALRLRERRVLEGAPEWQLVRVGTTVAQARAWRQRLRDRDWPTPGTRLGIWKAFTYDFVSDAADGPLEDAITTLEDHWWEQGAAIRRS